MNPVRLHIISLVFLLALLSTAVAQEERDDTTGMAPLPMLPLIPIDAPERSQADTTTDTLEDSAGMVDSLEESSPLGRTGTTDTVRSDSSADSTASLPPSDSTDEASIPDTSAGESPDDEDPIDDDMEETAREADFPARDTERAELPAEETDSLEEATPLGHSDPSDTLGSEAVSQHSPESPRNRGETDAPEQAAGEGDDGEEDVAEGDDAAQRPDGSSAGQRPDGTTAAREGAEEDPDAASENTPPWTRAEKSPMQGLRPVGEDDMGELAPMVERPLDYLEEEEPAGDPRFEITPWVGATFFREGGHPWAGLRFAEIAFWPAENARLWAQYDNGLSFDNLRVARSTETTPALYAGGFLNYEENHTTRAELGIRTLPGNISQVLVRTEQVYAFSDGHSLKGGLWLGPRSDGKTEWILHAGGGVPVSSSIRLDPTFFYSRSGDPGQKEWRILVSGEFTMMNGLRIAGGVAGGVMELGNGWKQGVAEEFLKVSMKIEDFYQLHALFKNETVGARRGITVIAAGFTWGFGGR